MLAVVVVVELDPVVDNVVVVVVALVVGDTTVSLLTSLSATGGVDGMAVVFVLIVVVVFCVDGGGGGGDGYNMFSKMSRFERTRGSFTRVPLSFVGSATGGGAVGIIVIVGLSIFSFFLFSRLALSCLSSSSRVAM